MARRKVESAAPGKAAKKSKAKKSVVPASRRSKTEARKSVNEFVISQYLSRLEAALGSDEEFLAAFNELQRDHEVGQAEAISIGSKFVAPMPASTSKTKALERILKRHKSLMAFKLRQKAIGGRSAA